PVSDSLEALAERFLASKHARLPLYNESIDQIIGILHIRDLFAAIQSGDDTDPARLTKEPFFVPETTSLPQLLRELQERHQQMAIVVDEYGGVSGLVTVEDLVEEIVGDIADEHEVDEDDRAELPGGGWRLNGRTELWELAELFEVELDDMPYETVSGMIVGELGLVPEPGAIFRIPHLAFTVETADERRVTTVIVEPSTAEIDDDTHTTNGAS
ncbi:MAG: transporter associated domain-containing protein, partial [Acidobacteriota bacterium]